MLPLHGPVDPVALYQLPYAAGLVGRITDNNDVPERIAARFIARLMI